MTSFEERCEREDEEDRLALSAWTCPVCGCRANEHNRGKSCLTLALAKERNQ